VVRTEEWERVPPGKLALFAAGLGGFVAIVRASEPGFIMGLDHANLLFHEAGHPIVGLVSQRLETYGGTLGQLVFPILMAVGFWKKGKVLSLAAASVWFWENFLNIARYMADARQLKLPLVGGGDHDWNTILARWDILQYDTRIAASLQFAAWSGIALTGAWVLGRAWQDRKNLPVKDDAVERLHSDHARLNG
jgi:hypothetical protein